MEIENEALIGDRAGHAVVNMYPHLPVQVLSIIYLGNISQESLRYFGNFILLLGPQSSLRYAVQWQLTAKWASLKLATPS